MVSDKIKKKQAMTREKNHDVSTEDLKPDDSVQHHSEGESDSDGLTRSSYEIRSRVFELERDNELLVNLLRRKCSDLNEKDNIIVELKREKENLLKERENYVELVREREKLEAIINENISMTDEKNIILEEKDILEKLQVETTLAIHKLKTENSIVDQKIISLEVKETVVQNQLSNLESEKKNFEEREKNFEEREKILKRE